MNISYYQTFSKGGLQKATSVLAQVQLAEQTVAVMEQPLLHTWGPVSGLLFLMMTRLFTEYYLYTEIDRIWAQVDECFQKKT